MQGLPDKSIHLSVYSPPFGGLYCYSSNDRDLSNYKDYDQFMEMYSFVVKELNRITARINKIVNALKVRGAYAAHLSEVGRIISADDNQMVAIENASEIANMGGLDKAIWIMPIDRLIQVLEGLYAARQQTIQAIYEITGLGDVMRGVSNPHETLGAQQIKSQWGSVRVRDRQMELARFLRDIGRLVGEVIAENFQPDTLMAMSNIHLPSDQPMMLPPLALPGFAAAAGAPSLPETAPPPPGVSERPSTMEMSTGGGVGELPLPDPDPLPVSAPPESPPLPPSSGLPETPRRMMVELFVNSIAAAPSAFGTKSTERTRTDHRIDQSYHDGYSGPHGITRRTARLIRLSACKERHRRSTSKPPR